MKNIISYFLSVAVLLCLTSCGGGGGGVDSTEGTNPPSNIPEAREYPAVTTVPAATYTDGRREAFNRINQIRREAGLGLLAQNEKLDTAAQKHADYLGLNGGAHIENPGSALFYGASPTERANKAGYFFNALVSETVWTSSVSSVDKVNGFMASAYHRIPFLDYANIDVGVGVKAYMVGTIQDGESFVVDFGYTFGNRQGSPDKPYVLWPSPNATVDILDQGGEDPSPGGRGHAISINVDSHKKIKVNNFNLRENGSIVDSFSLNAGNDQNLASCNFIAILSPKLPLKPASRYTARFDGEVDGKPLVVEWQFNTK